MSNKRALLRLGAISVPKTRYTVAMPKKHYASRPKKLEASMGGIFEPFLNDKIDKKLIKEEEPISAQELLGKVTVKDLLPDDDVLKLSLEHKQTTLPIEKQKELTSAVLDLVKNDKHDAEHIFKLVDNKATELTAFGNILLRSSKYGAPLALELYKYAMDKGDDRGAFSYANMVYRGYNGTPKNEDEGIRIMSQLAQKGHPYAQMNLAAILMRTQPDRVSAAIKLYELAGQAGLDNAYSELGRMYRLGYGAIEYFTKGAQSGNPQCNFMLGVYCSSGLGNDEREPDQKKAFKHFQKAAVKGMAEAQYNVGLRFLKGHGVEANSFNAAEFFRMAAVQGFQLAQVNLAGMYSEGRGVKSDLDEARAWLEKAASQGGSIGKDAQKRIEQLDEIQGKKRDKCNIM
ncbi:sel1 domain-containing protein [Mucor lusitanicus]